MDVFQAMLELKEAPREWQRVSHSVVDALATATVEELKEILFAWCVGRGRDGDDDDDDDDEEEKGRRVVVVVVVMMMMKRRMMRCLIVWWMRWQRPRWRSSRRSCSRGALAGGGEVEDEDEDEDEDDDYDYDDGVVDDDDDDHDDDGDDRLPPPQDSRGERVPAGLPGVPQRPPHLAYMMTWCCIQSLRPLSTSDLVPHTSLSTGIASLPPSVPGRARRTSTS
jgi:hypothetical protein